MTIATFDTLAFAKRMKKAGMTEQLAEEQAEAMAELFKDQLATKQDLKDLKHELIISMGSMIAIAVVAVPFILKIVNLV